MISPEQATALAEATEKLVRTVPGVDTLYPAGGAVSRIIESTLQATGLASAPCPVLVEDGDAVAVRISIGTDSTFRAGDVAQQVGDAVLELFRASGFSDPLLHLTVARVAEPLPSATAPDTTPSWAHG